MDVAKCQSIRDGIRTTLTGYVTSFAVSVGLQVRSPSLNAIFRDPTQHATLKEKIEAQSTAYYSTARLWDDGIIAPTDTRDAVGLGLALAARERGTSGGFGTPTTWDGNNRGFGVFRM
jgi:3-methylcrotonyl-CoA carboxylase beta subunit